MSFISSLIAPFLTLALVLWRIVLCVRNAAYRNLPLPPGSKPRAFHPSTYPLRDHSPMHGDLSSYVTASRTTSSGTSSQNLIVPSTPMSSPSKSAAVGGQPGAGRAARVRDAPLYVLNRSFSLLVETPGVVRCAASALGPL